VLLERAEKEELEEVGALEDLEGGEGENRWEKVNNRNQTMQPVSTFHHLPPDAIETLTDKDRWEDSLGWPTQ
jgi:hypothetical protein